MKLRKFSIEDGLFILAFCLALGLRLFHLGQAMLTDNEALIALQALDLSSGKLAVMGSQPGYVLLTGALFFLFGSNEFLARFWPAFMGSLVVFVPLLFRKKIGNQAAILGALALAIDPVLLAASRQADGQAIALSMTLLSLGFFYQGQAIAAGIAAGLALLSGPALWPGLLGLALFTAWWKSINVKHEKETGDSIPDESNEPEKQAEGFSWKTTGKASLPWMLGTVILVGTLLFRYPLGLNGIAESLLAYLQGWTATSSTSAIEYFILQVTYQPFALMLAIGSLWWFWRKKEEMDNFFISWWVIALLLAIIFPSRQPIDLAWCTVPLWGLAVRRLNFSGFFESEDRLPRFAQMLLAVILLTFSFLNFIGLANPIQGELDIQLHWAAVGGSLLMLILTALLVAWGWAPQTAWKGLSWGVMIFSLAISLSGVWHAVGEGRSPNMEPWRSGQSIEEGDLLVKTLGDFSEWKTGNRNGLDVTVVDINLPSMKWALRGVEHVQYLDFLPADNQPSILITKDQQDLALAASYSGQGFVWEQGPAWSLIFPLEWPRWMIYREATLEKRMAVLWIRTDIFPGAASTSPAVLP